jgi:protein-S-isoprenylcysteine O-methyltransferase Ste14
MQNRLEGWYPDLLECAAMARATGGDGWSAVLIGVQFAALGWLLATGSVVPARGLPLAMFGLGGALGAWAWVTIGARHLRIHPDPHPEGRLVTWGPYRFIRHPMYACTLLIAASWVASSPTPTRLGVLAVLAADLVLKLRHEEVLLLARYPGYAAYRERTHRLVPFVY